MAAPRYISLHIPLTLYRVEDEKLDAYPLPLKNPNPTQTKPMIDEFSKLALGYSALKSRAKSTEVGVGEDLSLQCILAPCNVTATVGVHFFLKDSESQDFLPAFIIRGNPYLANQKLGFKIREIQPWVSKYHTIKELKNNPIDQSVTHLLTNRQRLIDRATRVLNSGDHILGRRIELTRNDIFLLLTAVHLQGLGVETIEGIAHQNHPLADHAGKLKLNYDDLFGCWLTRKNPDQPHFYSWIMETAFSKGFVPKFPQLPGTARKVLMDVYHQTTSSFS